MLVFLSGFVACPCLSSPLPPARLLTGSGTSSAPSATGASAGRAAAGRAASTAGPSVRALVASLRIPHCTICWSFSPRRSIRH